MRATTPRPRSAGPRSRSARAVAAAGGGLAGAAGAATFGVAGAAVYFARRIVTPAGEKPDDVRVLRADAGTVTLARTVDTEALGRYGLWLDRGARNARLGAVVDADARSVTRRLLGVDGGGAVPAGAARWNQYFFAGTPGSALGLRYEDVLVPGPIGDLPGWVVPPAAGEGTTWAVLVHGRGATREETIRALPVLRRLGLTALVLSYRNDPEGPRSPAGRYHLGDTEWQDVEAALDWVRGRGARRIVLFGWSMGGAIVLQTVARSERAALVDAVVLNGPVIDWRDVLDHHARLNRIPRVVGRLGLRMLAHASARRVIGVEGPVDLRRLDWVSRASDLRLPVLLLHSEDDEYVPIGPSRRLAQARPDLVTLVPSRGASHTREWNVDPHAWELAVETFLRSRLADGAGGDVSR